MALMEEMKDHAIQVSPKSKVRIRQLPTQVCSRGYLSNVFEI